MVSVGVEFVVVEPVGAAQRFRCGGGDDRPVVDAVGAFVGPAAGGDAEDPLEGGEWGVGDGGDAESAEGSCGAISMPWPAATA